MRRRIKVAVLALGVLVGYGSAFCGAHAHHVRREAFERHVALVCVDAARGTGSPAPTARW